jgi:virginiamycin B lyase
VTTKMMRLRVACFLSFGYPAAVLVSAPAIGSKHPPEAGVQIPGIQHEMSELAPVATFVVKGDPDWMAVGPGAVWVTSSRVNHVVRLDAKTNQPGTIVTVARPCSGLAVGFGSLWVPSCGDHSLVRVNAQTGRFEATIAASPADSEGGIATGAGSVWIVTSKEGDLARIDPATNGIAAHIRIPPGSFNPIFANDSIWITCNAGNTLARVDPTANKVVSEVPVGPRPRFLTVGGGSIWVLNQGDGTVARVNLSTGKRIALIEAGIAGEGGEMTFGDGAVWATMIGYPITRISPDTNRVVGQWHGDGGDSIRVGYGSLWLTNLKGGKVWRLSFPSGANH